MTVKGLKEIIFSQHFYYNETVKRVWQNGFKPGYHVTQNLQKYISNLQVAPCEKKKWQVSTAYS